MDNNTYINDENGTIRNNNNDINYGKDSDNHNTNENK